MVGKCTKHFTIENDDSDLLVYPSINGCEYIHNTAMAD